MVDIMEIGSWHYYLAMIWFVLWGVLWSVYFILDGFDLGVGSLLPILAKNEAEKRAMLNSTGPFWDGNEVWLISAGGVTFAAFPYAYAQMFSGLYTALMLLLFALIIRGVSFEFRSKVESDRWKKIWDNCHFFGSLLPALLLGVAFGNIFQGLPLDETGFSQAGLFGLLNPYGLAGGVLFVVIFIMHGALWLTIRTTGDLHGRAVTTATRVWPVQVVLTVLFLAFTAFATQLFNNYMLYPVLFVVLALPVAGLVLMRTYLGAKEYWKAWAASCAYIGGVALFGVIGIFPAIIPSSPNPAHSLTIMNSASSQLTLQIMLGVALVFVPIVIGYQFWVYKNFATPMGEDDIHY
ncbi:Cytochrome d ubiquinol oxidase, subunit II [Pseudodesulfovibrio profundus]|uniref:Cytochrome d ubiquinol oxidase, subunit II n=1 Tax=Pseudodesulfovibrio profundus TaxID=57320 RepID=A0A2C8F970_9BACT|nr:cytochrome d ubiquinol oxidase subunit II [Pseudodesulfovibrio profundus]MBC16072.1 cytochrome d ubiquinol oxidase subunit II [Desulfovibrio sp.]SOB59315.1 Cytochrome d ubiquinol oxidase, subunit II [Pseudodesulfovibrio profundus]|tara:strand:- start:278 stop:1327 length:1050 start_codon:yes stop_codon:yes gene_type:complete